MDLRLLVRGKLSGYMISHITKHEHVTADGIYHSSNHLIMSVTTTSFRRLQAIVYVATWDVCEIMLCITLIMLWDCKLHIPNKIPIYLPTCTLHLGILLIIGVEAFEHISITMPAVYTHTGIIKNQFYICPFPIVLLLSGYSVSQNLFITVTVTCLC